MRQYEKEEKQRREEKKYPQIPGDDPLNYLKIGSDK